MGSLDNAFRFLGQLNRLTYRFCIGYGADKMWRLLVTGNKGAMDPLMCSLTVEYEPIFIS
jgi:hypothetical protein